MNLLVIQSILPDALPLWKGKRNIFDGHFVAYAGLTKFQASALTGRMSVQGLICHDLQIYDCLAKQSTASHSNKTVLPEPLTT